MSDMPHLLIPLAASPAQGCQQALEGLELPQLDRLLARLSSTGLDAGAETDFAPPHERALARHHGLPATSEGTTPWAAWHQHQQVSAPHAATSAWAFITPCHWQVGADHVTLGDPARLQLDEAASRALLAIVAPWFAEDGITLTYDQPTRWVAQGAVFDNLPTASLDRVIQRDVRAWMPDPARARLLHRLHSEMQMLLYTHPFNDARGAQGLPAVNSFWVHGTGALPADLTTPAQPPQVADALRAPALREDWRAWASAWTALDAGPVAALLRQAEQGQPVRLTLSGEHSAQSFHTAPLGLVQRIQRFLRPQRFMDVREQL